MNTELKDILEKMRIDAERNGYHLCPDGELLEDLIDGLATNMERYGYGSCPCRISSGIRTYDADIICPCEYRDADVDEFGMCYCCLFVSDEVSKDPSKMGPITERRPDGVIDASLEARDRLERGESESGVQDKDGYTRISGQTSLKYPVWRCTVCGYLAARETPPPICPICKAKADRFERFM